MSVAARARVRLLVPVWGKAYVESFADLALRSWMAPGNIPALAEACDVELVILTTSDSVAFFEGKPIVSLLKERIPLSFMLIDDLMSPLSGLYGVTLTLAFTRGIAAVGAGMLQTYFVFLNSDFVLADGSLRTLLKSILNGRSCIVAPSFRAIAEEVEPLLRKAVDARSQVLAISPRRLVGMALEHLHGTTRAKTIGQGMLRPLHANQLYWRVDESTMLARFYLMFMLCIRPARLFTQSNSFCDYGFVPEMRPGGSIEVLSDSDGFFMLETQRRDQESEQIGLGAADTRYLAAKLSEWTTKEHRAAARHDLFFHASALPATTREFSKAADEYVNSIEQLMGRPLNHAFHPYWVGGVNKWLDGRAQTGVVSRVPEIAPDPLIGASGSPVPRVGSWREKLRRLAKWAFVGERPRLRPWHHDWPGYRAMADTVVPLFSDAHRVAIFSDEALNGLFAAGDGRITSRPTSDLDVLSGSSGTFDAVLCHLSFGRLVTSGANMVPRAMGLCRPGGHFVLVVSDLGGFGREDALMQALRHLLPLTAAGPERGMVYVAGSSLSGRLERSLRLAQSRLLGGSDYLLSIPRFAFISFCNVINNLFLARRRRLRGGTAGVTIAIVCSRSGSMRQPRES